MKKPILIIALILNCWVLSAWADNKTPLKPESDPVRLISQPSAPAAFQIPWTSINGGGDVSMSSTNYKAKVTTGQSVIGESQSTNYKMGIGFWYGSGIYCLGKAGDANASGTYSLSDVIATVNYIFNKPGCSPQPLCWISSLLCRGDWNGSGTVSLSDVIQAVNYIFNKPNGPWNAVPVGVCCL
jgi:hypothetical protein